MQKKSKNTKPIEINEDSIVEGIRKALALYQKSQEALAVFANKDESDRTTLLKIGTILNLSILKKLHEGKNIKSFDQEDWKEIASQIMDYAIFMEGDCYSASIFLLYAKYIEYSVANCGGFLSEQSFNEIVELVEQLRSKTEAFRNGGLKEGVYTEDCLWLCLEAMIKLITGSMSIAAGEEYKQLISASTTFIIRYAECQRYKKEQKQLIAIFHRQKELDKELEQKYQIFITEYEKEAAEFEELINKAFSAQGEDQIYASAELARAAGVKEEDILDTKEKIEEFFLN